MMKQETAVTQLAPARFDLAINGMRYNVFRARPELGTPLDAITNPAYWAHVAAKLRVGDIIEVVPEDLSSIAELFVRDVAHLTAKVALKSFVDFTKTLEKTETPSGFEAKWRGPTAKWCAVRGKDVLKEGFTDKAEADNWIKESLVDKKVA